MENTHSRARELHQLIGFAKDATKHLEKAAAKVFGLNECFNDLLHYDGDRDYPGWDGFEQLQERILGIQAQLINLLAANLKDLELKS